LQAAIESVESRYQPLDIAFEAIVHMQGVNAAKVWAAESGCGALSKEADNLHDRANNLFGRMVDLRPSTQAGIAAVAASIKDELQDFWKDPEPDRDWEISLFTRFIDGLIECGSSEKIAVKLAEPKRCAEPQ
jgi:hypothetical protein